MALVYLRIKNFVIVKEIEIEFSEGLNIFTGETGAGKSLIINALASLTGERTDYDIVGKFSHQATIEALFEKNGEEILIKKVIDKSKRKVRIFINDNLSTQSKLKEIVKELFDIHGQHKHQLLLDEKTHMFFLDKFGDINLENYKEKWHKYVDLKQKFLKEKENIEKLIQMKEFLEYQYNELSEANLKENEDIEIQRKIEILSNYESIFQNVENAIYEIYESEDSLINKISKVRGNLEQILKFKKEIKNYVDKFYEWEQNLQDIYFMLVNFKEEISYSPEELSNLNERLFYLNKLKEKYKKETLKELIDYKNELAEKLSKIEIADEYLKKLEENLKDLEKELWNEAKSISEKRKEVAKIFSDKVCNELKELGMPKSKFVAKVEVFDKLTENGINDVRFLFSANPGEDVKPLYKVASGGELSRIMLALKVVLLEKDIIPTMIFDEIDVGVSGKIAQVVGKKLKKVSKIKQVICITHLPQIAAFADKHFKVFKEIKNGYTETKIKELKTIEDRAKEIAYLISGEKITEYSIKQAKSLIEESLKINRE